MNPKYKFITDAGHGWLQVKHSELKGLEGNITKYSYKDSTYAYLEEDCDMMYFMNEKKLTHEDIVEVNYDNDCFVRGLNHY